MCVKVLQCAELVGYFVSADVWCRMTLDQVAMSQSSASLSVLAAVIRGSEMSQLSLHLTDISTAITQPTICQVADVRMHTHTQLLTSCHQVTFYNLISSETSCTCPTDM